VSLLQKLSRLLVPVVVGGAVLLVPGVAIAGDDPPNPADLANQVQDAVTGGTGSGGVPTGGLPTGGTDPAGGLPTGGTDPAGGTDPSGGTGSGTAEAPAPAPPDGLDPSALQPLFDALGISPECSAAMQEDFQGVIDSVPLTVQAIIDAIVSQLPAGGLPSPTEFSDPASGATVLMAPAEGGQPPTFTAEDPPSLPVVDALQKMFADFQALCVPAPPTEGASQPPTSPGPALQPPAAAPPAPAPAPAPAAPQPVTYPGYAPTGGTPDVWTGPVPLAALAGVVLVSAAAAVGYRVSLRGTRSRG
jgi:hypothetical protein